MNYSKIAYEVIEKGWRDIINDEFRNVYISDIAEEKGDESIRINLVSSEDILTMNNIEEREYIIDVFYSFINDDSGRNQYVKNRVDRLKQLIYDNATTNNWFGLSIPIIDYAVEDDRSEVKLTITVRYLDVI
jgi:hypothetical protein